MSTNPNLLPMHLLRRRSQRRRVHQWQAVLLFSTCLSGGIVLFLNAQVQDPSAETEETIDATVAQIDRLSGAVGEARTEFRALQRQLAVATEVSTKPDWSILLAVLAEHAGGRAELSSVQLSAQTGGFRLTLLGVCPDQATLSSFVESLEDTGLFAKVKATQTQAVELTGPSGMTDTRTSFTVLAEIIEGA